MLPTERTDSILDIQEQDEQQDNLIARNAKDIADMQDRINKLEIYANKLAWKIAVSVVAASAFVLSLLQVSGIF